MSTSPFGAYPVGAAPSTLTATATTTTTSSPGLLKNGIPTWLKLLFVAMLAIVAFGLYTQYKAYSRMSSGDLRDTLVNQAEMDAARSITGDIANILK